jgi:uncharacterized membrane protein (UPF0127 family)
VIADRAIPRMRGLLGRATLPAGEGILLTPAPSIHTAFMRFPIDIVFADRWLKVVKISADVEPFRTATSRHARYALELPAGEAGRRGIEVGDQLAVGVTREPGSTSSTAALGDADDVGGEPVVLARPKGLAEVQALRAASSAICVLLVGTDRRFRSVATALLERRGLIVAVEQRRALRDPAALAGADVIVLDAGSSLTAAAQDAAAVSALVPDVGIVVVADRQLDDLSSMPVVSKWGPVDALIDAIEDAHQVRTTRRSGTFEDVGG